jgi:hypothetical protein
LLVKDYRGKDANQEVWKFDSALEARLADDLKQAAIEEGQWTEKRQVEAAGAAERKARINRGRGPTGGREGGRSGSRRSVGEPMRRQPSQFDRAHRRRSADRQPLPCVERAKERKCVAPCSSAGSDPKTSPRTCPPRLDARRNPGTRTMHPETEYFGVLTYSPEGSLDKRPEIGDRPAQRPSAFAAVNGRHTAGRSRSALAQFEFSSEASWSDPRLKSELLSKLERT